MFAPLPSSCIRVEEKELPQPIRVVQSGDDTPIMGAGGRGRHNQATHPIGTIDQKTFISIDPTKGIGYFGFPAATILPWLSIAPH